MTRGFSVIRMVLAVVVVMSGLPALNRASAAEPREKLFNECAQCHVDLKHKTDIPVATLDKCKNCHGEVPRHPSGTVARPADTEVAKAEIKTDPFGGMRFAQYSPQSRLGDAPNEMVQVPAGVFTRGTNDRLPDEGPQHEVDLAAFQIDQYEVTNLQYKKFLDATKRRSPNHFVNRTFPDGKADHPVVYVSWVDADAYCAWAGKRLPTDQEWEKAARGTDGRIFPWGGTFDFYKANTPHRWKLSGKEGDTTPVGSFEAGKSPYGVYDMTGNVWEWTASWYAPYPGNTHITENYGEKYKTLKGGSWWDCSFYQCGISAPVYNRSFFLRATKNSSFGFRCAKDAQQAN